MFINKALTETLTQLSINGTTTFSSLAISTPGTFWLRASADNCLAALSLYFSINYGRLQSIIILPQENPILVKYLTILHIELYNSTSLLPYSVLVQIYNANILINSTIAYNGTTELTVFFNSSGLTALTIFAEEISTSIAFEIFPSNNTDSFCLIASSASTCLYCIEITNEIINGTCTCISNSTYNVTINQCICNQGLTASNGYCITCGNYFQYNEVSSYYNNDYRSIIINFQRRVNISYLNNCQDILIITDEIKSFGPECIWSNGYTLIVNLKTYPILAYNYIEINSINVQAQGDLCNFNIVRLKLVIAKLYQIPLPYSEILSPDTFITTCAISDLIISSGTINSFYLYSWSAVITPENYRLMVFISKANSYELIIPSNLLTPSIISLNLQLEIINLGTISTASKEILITNTKALQVWIEGGNWLSIKQSDSYRLQATIPSSCFNDIFSYVWTSSVSEILLEEYLSNSLRPNALNILPQTLKSQDTYIFTVAVTSNTTNLLAMGSIIISIEPDNLQLTLSRSSGYIGLDGNLIINASAFDPDDNLVNIQMQWTCSQSFSQCLDKNGNLIQLITNNGQLLVYNSSLIDQNSYNFTIKASTYSKSIIKSIEIFVDKNIIGDMYFALNLENINTRNDLYISVNVSLEGSPLFKWTIIQDGNETIGSIEGYSYLYISEGLLYQGHNYEINLKAYYKGSATEIISYSNIYANLGPFCSGISTSLQKYLWTLIAENCYDGDNNNYPLLYQYGAIRSDNSLVLLSSASLDSFFTGYLFTDTIKIYAKVSDSLGVFNEFYSEFKTHRSRRMQPLQIELESMLNTPKMSPNIALILSEYNISINTYAIMQNNISTYFMSEFIDSSSFNLYIDCFKAFLSFNLFITIENLQENLNTLSAIIKNYKGKPSKSNLFTIISCIEPYLDIINVTQVNEIIENLIGKMINNTTPYNNITYSNAIVLEKIRTFSSNYSGFIENMGLNSISFPESADFNDKTMIYDFYYSIIYSNNNITTSIFMQLSGIYQNYTLELFTPELLNFTLTHPILFTIPNLYQYTAINCQGINNNNEIVHCSIKDITNMTISFEIYDFCRYTLINSLITCPIITKLQEFLILFFLITLLITISLRILDRKNQFTEDTIRSFLLIYSMTSIFISQNPPKRALSAIEMLTNILIVLGLLVTFQSNLNIYSSNSTDFSNFFDTSNIKNIFTALGVVQIFTIISYWIRMSSYYKKKHNFYAIFWFFGFYMLVFGYLIFLSMSYCYENSIWLINFVFCMIFELFLLHPVYAFILLKIFKRKKQEKIHPTGVSEESIPMNIHVKHMNTVVTPTPTLENETNRLERHETDLDMVWRRSTTLVNRKTIS